VERQSVPLEEHEPANGGQSEQEQDADDHVWKK
jgi:hypothetical protein